MHAVRIGPRSLRCSLTCAAAIAWLLPLAATAQSRTRARSATVTVVESTGKDPFGEMLRVAPPELMKKIYRLIAAEIHPDKGGKPEDMITLNAAWTEVKKEKGL